MTSKYLGGGSINNNGWYGMVEDQNPWVSWTSFTIGNKLHNEEGPALFGTKKDGKYYSEYWIDGKQLTEEEFESRKYFRNKSSQNDKVIVKPSKAEWSVIWKSLDNVDYIPLDNNENYTSLEDEDNFVPFITFNFNDRITKTLNEANQKLNYVMAENESLKKENEELKEYKRRSDWGKINDANTRNLFSQGFIDIVEENERLKKEVEHLKKLIGGEVFLPQPPDYAPEGYAIEVIKSLGLLHNHFYDIITEKPDYRPITVKIQKLIDEVNRCYSKLSKYREFKGSIEVAIEALEWAKQHDILDDNHWAPAQDALKRMLDLRHQE